MKQIWNKPKSWIIYNDRLSNFSNTVAIFCHRILEPFYEGLMDVKKWKLTNNVPAILPDYTIIWK